MLFGRHIYDIIWDGPSSTIAYFVVYCNNKYGLAFTRVINIRSLLFLDLELSFICSNIISSNNFKTTADNSSVNSHSCHYPRWNANIPKSQFHRLCRNCTIDGDYIEQSKVLKQKFIKKGYQLELIEEAFVTYLGSSRITQDPASLPS